jgi:RNA-directed DNA polymerase
MDFLNYKDAFTNEAIQRGYSEQNIQRCLDYAIIFQCCSRNLQYFSFVSISGHKEYKEAAHTKYFYRDFEVVAKRKKDPYI